LPQPGGACALALNPAPASALDQNREDVAAFIGEMQAQYGFEAASLTTLFGQVESRPAIVEAISRPAERVLLWYEYRARFMTDRRVARGRDVAREQAAPLAKAAGASGVPASILLGIVGVETFYGEITGKYRVIDALSTLAFDYPPRSQFFRGELEQFLLMTREESLDPLAPLGSYAGAMGIPQFMPTSVRSFAVDGSGDGRRDLWGDWSDVFASVGNYLRCTAGAPENGRRTRDGRWRQPRRHRDRPARAVDDRRYAACARRQVRHGPA
jgi:membrane-bound lytic murein transglycosylase B